MVHGALRVCGEPLELKVKYGLGYKLHCARSEQSETYTEDKGLVAWVAKRVPHAKAVWSSDSEVGFLCVFVLFACWKDKRRW
jgi:hypothetical protein